MSLFEPVTLTWKGQEYVVKPDQVMYLIAIVEDKITLRQLSSGDVPFSRTAQAFGAALRYAGAKVNDDEVYLSLFGDGGVGAVAAVSSLLAMLIPPKLIQDKMVTTPKKTKTKTKTG